MAEPWPVDLPLCFLEDSEDFEAGDGRLMTPPDAGPPKIRARTSAVSDQLVGEMRLTAAQRASLLTFYKVALLNGSGVMLFPNPWGGGELTSRLGPPRIRKVGRADYVATLQVEVLP